MALKSGKIYNIVGDYATAIYGKPVSSVHENTYILNNKSAHLLLGESHVFR